MNKIGSSTISLLDGFRGIAILLVILYHVGHILNFGWIGVDLFFVLSGFLITGKLVEAIQDKNYFRVFYIKRIARIVPAYYFLLLVVFVITPALFHSVATPAFIEMKSHQFHYWLFMVNILDAYRGWPAYLLFVPLWSLSVEMQFYLLWPFITRGYIHFKKMWLLLMIAFCVLAVFFRIYAGYFFNWRPLYRYVMLPGRLDDFALGGLLYISWSKDLFKKKYFVFFLLAVLCLVAAISIMIYFHTAWAFSKSPVDIIGYSVNGLFWFFLISFSLRTPNKYIQRLLSAKWLTMTGKYSYGMYLFHVPVYLLVTKCITSLHVSTGIEFVIITFCSVLLTYIIAYLSSTVIERPFLKMRNIFSLNK